jgi:hypothetical protein
MTLPDKYDDLLIKSHKDKRGKYGRFIVEVFIPKSFTGSNGYIEYTNLNKLLVQRGHAKIANY